MKKLIKKVLIFSFAFFVFDKLFYVVIYYAPEKEIDKRIEYLITGKINKDVIVLGSSRGARNIIASQIEEETGLSAYNLSYPGSDVEFHEFLLKTLIKFNKTPKIVLLAVDDPSELLPSESILFRFDRLYPLAKYNYINQELVNKREISVLSWFFVLARTNKSTFDFRKKQFTSLDCMTSCGSMPIPFQRDGREWSYAANNNYPIEKEMPSKIKSFRNIQERCKKSEIDLFLVISPNFQNQNILFQNRLKELSNKETYFYVYDTTKEEVYKNKNYYYDESHLMLNGAKIFTSEISLFLTGIMNSKSKNKQKRY